VKNVDGEGKEEWVPLLPPLVGVESIKGEKLGREEEDKERDALELGVVTRPGEAVFPPIAGDGEGETEPPPLPPTCWATKFTNSPAFTLPVVSAVTPAAN
jgi:hypothetical protein